MSRRGSNQLVVENCKAALDQMKYEIAAELGLTSNAITPDQLGMTEFAAEDFGSYGVNGSSTQVPWGRLKTRDVGHIGGSITRRLVEQAEKILNGSI
ncbi:small, acid-soluble spore protein, alpha/beta type [Paenibacillus sp. GCM10027626]|uniref:small, acid-soluble spore protein, alpha/beta type n=1 Tax=Paenibacillus sp. GCM10027626 TaxID=3273411 RepID=UPI0036428898